MPQVAAISQQIWDMKYRLKNAEGQPVDKTIEDSWRRVAQAVAEAEPTASSEDESPSSEETDESDETEEA